MSTNPPSAIFREAADELAQEFLGRQFRDSITDRDAAEHVTSTVAASWIALQLCDQPAQAVLSELIFNLTDAEATNLLSALLMQDDIPTLAHLSRVMHAQVAHALAYEAEKIVDNYCPTDEEMSRSSSTDSSVRAEYKTMARADAAHYRRTGEYPSVL